MRQDGKDENKIEVFKSGEVLFDRRRASSPPPRISEREPPPDLVAKWNVIRKRRWTVIAVFILVFTTVLVGTLEEKPVYRANALIEIERENPSLVTSQQVLQLDDASDAYLETQYKILNSEDLADRVIDQLGLDKVAEFRPAARSWQLFKDLPFSNHPAPSALSSSGEDPGFRETVLKRFQDRLDIKPIRRSLAVEIHFTSQDPDLAVRVVDALTADYIQKNLQARWDAAQTSSEWLTQQLGDLKAKLEKSEGDLQKYASDNGLLVLETDKGNSESIENQSLRELQQEVTRAQASRVEKESLHRLVQAGDYGSLPGVFDNKLLQDLSFRLAELQREHAQLSATFNEDYPRVQQVQSQIAEIQGSLDRERRRAAEKISNDYFAALRQEKLLQDAFAEKQKQANQVAEKSVQYGILSRDAASDKDIYDGLLLRLKEAGVSAGLKASNIRVVDPAKASYKPVAPILPLNLGLAVVIGLGLGICDAFLLEHLNRTILSAGDVDRFLRIPALGFIPSVESLRARKNGCEARTGSGYTVRITDSRTSGKRALVIGRPQNDPGVRESSILSEAFRGLRTSVILSDARHSCRTILVTSAQPGEGKTTIAMNLAASLAQLGRRTLLIDADLRRPSVHKYFPQIGSRLSSYLAGQGPWPEMVYQSSISGLYVLLCGPVPANPAELISSEAMRNLVRDAKLAYNFVVLDSPPLLTVADSRILASLADATVLVVKGGGTPRQEVQYAASQARSAGANLLGVVVNNLDVRFTDFPYYNYGPSEDVPVQA
jgi:capsular exopolysaccharide synthesis family protein